MNKLEVKEIVNKINEYLSHFMWMDFSIEEVRDLYLKIVGSIDFSYEPNSIEIYFEGVTYAELVLHGDIEMPDDKIFIELVEDYDIINHFRVEPIDCHVFKLRNSFADDCIIYAKSIGFKIELKDK